MIPLIVTAPELALLNDWVREVAADALEAAGVDSVDYLVGTMIETPRAALAADEIAEVAEFFSFGTNDLTQSALGFSRDDVESRILSTYIEEKIVDRSPFETIDKPGVGWLVRLASWVGREGHPGLKLGICGEHGGDPESIAFFDMAGLDYVSCSPYRVPIARLAAAQSQLK
jgi:pyruvate,orthophosphate dikinase